jgi:hypothetical protein
LAIDTLKKNMAFSPLSRIVLGAGMALRVVVTLGMENG